jgi:amino acid adenylation domain-containing protein
MGIADIEAIYPLAPTQEAILLSSLHDSAEEKICCQLVCEINGRIEAALFERAWAQVIEQCQILRTSFIWKRLGQPRQMVHKSLKVPIAEQDWRNLTPAEQEYHLEDLLRANQAVGLDPRKAPLMRLSLAKKSDDVFVFIWDYHPLLLDDRSARVMFHDILLLYEQMRDSQTSGVKKRRPFRDYVSCARNRTSSTNGLSWVDLVDGTQKPTDVALNQSRSCNYTRDARRAERQWMLPKALSEKLRRLTTECQVELETPFLAAWAKLIGRYSGQDRVVFAVTSAECDSELDQWQTILGQFTSTLPIVVRIDSRMQIMSWMEEIDSCWRNLRRLAAGPAEDLNQVTKTLKEAALRGSRIEFEKRPFVEKEESLMVRRLETRDQHENPLLLSVSFGDVDTLGIRYAMELYDAKLIERIFGLLQVILETIVEKPASSLSDLPALTAEEYERLSVAVHNTRSDYPMRSCTHELFEAQVKQTPEALSVISESEQLTYQELNKRANQLAHYLQKMGVGPESRVGILMERSVEMVVALLATLKAGGAYVPLDPATPNERLAFILEDAHAAILLTRKNWALALSNHNAQVVCMDTERETILRQSEKNPLSGVTVENIAYVIYTSGSTGRPKGVLVPHANVGRLFAASSGWFHFNERDVWTLYHSYAFDFSVWEMWGALLHGGRLVIVPYLVSRSPEDFYKLLQDERVTVLNQTPSAFRQLMRYERSAGDTRKLSLRLVIFGGEALDFKSLQTWFNRDGDERLVNMYGITETTVHVTYRPVTRADATEAVGSFIGGPIPDLQVYVLDRHLQPTPLSIAGEMYVGGAGLARGYLNSPGLTAERFVPDPFTQRPGARLYKTGDLARHLENGDLEYLGRIDNQVKIRGYRVELGEIESVLISHSSIRDAVVIAKKDPSLEKTLVAYLILEPGTQITNKQIQSFVRKRLPNYMTPSAYVTLDAFPLTENGKIDRQSLQAFDSQTHESRLTLIPPSNPIEEILADIWMDVLRVGEIGMDDNFFDVGGHSLLATQIVSRLREVFDVEIPLLALFEFPTIAGLAQSLEAAKWARIEEKAASFRPVQRDRDLPLSFAQQRLWFIDQMQPGNPAYNAPQSVRLIGRLNVDALRRTLTEIVRRHEALRTTFAIVGDEPVQRVHRAQPIAMPEVDLSELDERAVIEARRLAAEEATRGFDLGRDIMLRAKLVRLGEEDHVVLFTMHHIASDGWSQGVLMREVSILYEAFSEGVLAPLEDLEIQYGDFAVWQREWLSGEVLEKQLGYWKKRLGGASRELEIPGDKPRLAAQSYRGAVEPINLNNKVRDGLRDLNRQEGVTMFMTLLAGLKALLYKYSGQEGISVGTGIANRTRKETERLIGFFVNTLVLRTDMSGDPTFRELLKREREIVLEAYAHQDVPFEMLVEELDAERDLKHTPLFQVLFVLQNVPSEPLSLPGLRLSRFNIERITAKFDISLSLHEDAQGIHGLVEYNTDIFKAETIARMIKNYSSILEEIIQYPDRHINDISTISEEESQFLICAFNED